MRKLMFLAVTLLALAIAAPATAATKIAITAGGFQPAQVTVGAGDTVTWTNEDSLERRIVADGGAFSSPVLASGSSYTFRFDRAGTFPYHDETKTAQKGTVMVRATGARSVTIAVGRRSVVMGSTVELSGSISNGQAAQQVTIVGKPYRGVETRTTVTTDEDGTWRLVVRPRIRTEYQAEWGNTISSESPIVYVRPNVQLRVLNGRTGRLYTKVTAVRSYRGKVVTLQRRSGGSWVKVRRVRLGANGVARFTARLPRTARVRVLAPSAPGYLQGYSRTALVRR